MWKEVLVAWYVVLLGHWLGQRRVTSVFVLDRHYMDTNLNQRSSERYCNIHWVTYKADWDTYHWDVAAKKVISQWLSCLLKATHLAIRLCHIRYYRSMEEQNYTIQVHLFLPKFTIQNILQLRARRQRVWAPVKKEIFAPPHPPTPTPQKGRTGKGKVRKQSRDSYARWPLAASAVDTKSHYLITSDATEKDKNLRQSSYHITATCIGYCFVLTSKAWRNVCGKSRWSTNSVIL